MLNDDGGCVADESDGKKTQVSCTKSSTRRLKRNRGRRLDSRGDTTRRVMDAEGPYETKEV